MYFVFEILSKSILCNTGYFVINLDHISMQSFVNADKTIA